MDGDERVRVVGDWYETRDRALLSPDVVQEIAEGFPHGGVYRGVDAIYDGFFPAIRRDFPDWRVEVERIVAADEMVVVIGRYRGRAAATGRSVDAPFVHLWRVVGGRIVWLRTYTDTLLVDRALHPIDASAIGVAEPE